MLTEDSTICNNWPELAQAVARPVRLDYRVAAMHLVRTEANDPEVRSVYFANTRISTSQEGICTVFDQVSPT